ncbi:MAG TPA: hypothetical protein VGH99_22555 [Pseudonocardia sp.]|jgi:hypothetical protein
MDLYHGSSLVRRPTAAPALGGAAGRSARRLRRDAHRHGQLTLGDHLAFWRAHRFGRQCSRAVSPVGLPAHLRVTLVLLFLSVGLIVGVFV